MLAGLVILSEIEVSPLSCHIVPSKRHVAANSDGPVMFADHPIPLYALDVVE